MNELKINEDKCHVDKRSLILDCEFNYYSTDTHKDEIRHAVFHHDHWQDKEVTTLKIDNKQSNDFTVITVYKHCLQAYFEGEGDAKIFIDRRYDHNYEYDVYYFGKHYLVNCAKSV